MISVAANLRRLACAVPRVSLLHQQGHGIRAQRVYRVAVAEGLGPTDSWERRIIEVGEGKEVSEIMETLYVEEIRAGAWAVDVGLWKRLFDQCVTRTISELAARGYIYLEHDKKGATETTKEE